MGDNNFQRKGAVSNTQAGNDFENKALEYFKNRSKNLFKQYTIEIGIEHKKDHKFDLGNSSTIIECKSMKWTKSGKVPSAKIENWNMAMYYFYLAPSRYKKIFFVEMDYSEKRGKTLLEYYIDNYYNLIPKDVLLYDYDGENKRCKIYTHDNIVKRVNLQPQISKH
jgi:hypothetical protein